MNGHIIIGADIVPTNSNIKSFETGDMSSVVDEDICKLFQSADYRILNLEVPLCDLASPIRKCGPNLIASTKSINGLKSLAVDFVTIANNHIMDQGIQGLISTIETLSANGISFSGGGQDLNEASKSYIFEVKDKRIGIYCCAEHEFSIARGDFPGANPFDPLESLDHIYDLRKITDYVVCLYHGGKEYYQYPSPYLQKVCRKIVDKGANLVVCQHSHCVGCCEKYRDCTIVYGQGNFLFDHGDSELRNASLLISIDVSNCFNIDYIPIVKKKNGVSLADLWQSKQILDDFFNRSEKIKLDGFIEDSYTKFAVESLKSYISTSDCITKTFLYRVANRFFSDKVVELLTKTKLRYYREWLINQYTCEAHRELIIKGLEEYPRKI